MKRASALFPEDARKRVAEAVAAAETRTSAEIVPVVATQSGRYDRAEDAFGLLLGLALFCGAWFIFQGVEATDWGGTTLNFQWWHAVLLILLGVTLGAAVASRVGWLRALFTPRREMRAEVERAAGHAFFDQRVHHTQGACGLMLYVSLFEHEAVTLADEQVAAKLGQEAMDEICAALTKAMRSKPASEAMIEAIKLAGDKLAEVLPGQADRANELPDALIVID
jgi:putative membrane protein